MSRSDATRLYSCPVTIGNVRGKVLLRAPVDARPVLVLGGRSVMVDRKLSTVGTDMLFDELPMIDPLDIIESMVTLKFATLSLEVLSLGHVQFIVLRITLPMVAESLQ